MSFRKHRPYRKAVRMGQTPRLEGCRTADDSSINPRHVHTKRARVLRRRGYHLERCGNGWVWYETNNSWFSRKFHRDLAKSIRKAARSPLYWDDAGLCRLQDAVTKSIVDSLRLAPGEGIFGDIRTASGYSLDVLAAQIPMTSDALRARMSPRMILTVPTYARIEDPLETDEAFIKRVLAAARQPTEAEYREALKAGTLSPDDLPITLRFKLQDEGVIPSAPYDYTQQVAIKGNHLSIDYTPKSVVMPQAEFERIYGKPLESPPDIIDAMKSLETPIGDLDVEL